MRNVVKICQMKNYGNGLITINKLIILFVVIILLNNPSRCDRQTYLEGN
ncbi:hypothetical protein THF1C08_1300005 [Vibrio jasicida]|uniref:Uncharacterized protein n=1 Tax=Vibrio jasicida TaxID=766224 RepID=A0AAU9QHJ2_9VIBR|nr:hypothetical protein THF1C08_1300005 [Vibrio jasicida]CAH1575958.1 hypothetical protein THF1A12_1340006 [Vibrio jasicida]